MAQHPLEAPDEVGGQATALGVEGVQVGVEVLARAVHPVLDVRLLAHRPVAAQLGEVGEDGQQVHLVGDRRAPRRRQLVARGEVAGEGAGLVAGVEVVAEQHRGQVGPGARRPLDHVAVDDVGGQVEVGGLGGRVGAGLDGTTGGLEPGQGGAGLDLAAGGDVQLLEPGGERRGQHRLHLHALEHEHRGAGGDLVAHGERRRDDECRCGRTQHATLVAAHPVGDTVDLDELHGAVRGGDQAVRPAADADPARVGPDPLEVGLHRDDLAARLGDGHPEALRPGAVDGDLVGRAAQLEVDRAPDVVLHLGATAPGRLEQAGALDGLGLLVGLDAGDDQGHARVLAGHEAALAAHPVDPAGVGGAVDDLGLVEQVEDERLVRGTALDDDRRLPHRAAQPGQGLVTVTTVGDDLGDHRVEVRGDRVALCDTGVDADAGTRRQLEVGDAPGRRREVAVGVLGVEPGLDGVADLVGPVAGEPAPGGDVQLQPHEVGAGDHLGDRVLDLQAGVHLEEGEEAVARVVEELHGAGTGVPDRDGEPLGRRLELAGLRDVEHRRGRLLDDLLVAALHRAVAHADRPRRALPVGDDLHLDVPRAGDQLLEEQHARPEGPLRLVTGALVGVGELGVGLDLADAAPAAPRGGLEHEGVADPGRRGDGVVEGVDPAPAPRGDRHADLLGDQLRPDLVAEATHGLGARPDEGHPDALAELGEGGVLGDEAPAHPGGVGPGLEQGPLQHGVVEVGALRRGPEVVGGVRLADEHGRALGLGVQGHRLDAVPAGPGLRVDVTHGVDQPHRGLSAVDDGDPLEHRWSSRGSGVCVSSRAGSVPPVPEPVTISW